MGNIRDISDRYKKRTLVIDNCSGCGKEIKDGEEYTQVGIPSAYNDDEVTHIALCKGCVEEAENEGVL